VAFRAQYLKDVVLPRILNDESFLLLNNIIRTNYQQILERLESDTEFLAAVSDLMKTGSADEPTHRSLVAFMKELFMMMKTLSREGSLSKYGHVVCVVVLFNSSLCMCLSFVLDYLNWTFSWNFSMLFSFRKTMLNHCL